MHENKLQFFTIVGVILLLAIFLVPVHSGADPDLPDEAFAQKIPANDPFPHQKELSSRVNFWRHVFGIWSSRQAALHDMSNPGLVYEVLTLPSGKRGADRREFVNNRVEDLIARLYELEQKFAIGKQLDDDEQALLDKFRNHGKISQLAGAHSRIRVQYGIRDKFLQGIETSGRYDAIFRRIFRSYGVPEDVAFLPHIESSFQSHARSGAGAVGIWQFTLPAARIFMNVNEAIDERYDPVLAAEGCARYLVRAYEKLGDWGLAITSYNHGIGGMSQAKSKFGKDFPKILEEYDGSQFGFDSRNFYVEFLAAREVARNAERYFAKVDRERPLAWEKVALDSSAPIYQVARDYGVTLTELAEMNTALTNNALKGRVALPEGTRIWLPKGTQQRLASRSRDEELPIARQIRVVRTPDVTEGRMVAMIENPVPSRTKTDVPITTTLSRVKVFEPREVLVKDTTPVVQPKAPEKQTKTVEKPTKVEKKLAAKATAKEMEKQGATKSKARVELAKQDSTKALTVAKTKVNLVKDSGQSRSHTKVSGVKVAPVAVATITKATQGKIEVKKSTSAAVHSIKLVSNNGLGKKVAPVVKLTAAKTATPTKMLPTTKPAVANITRPAVAVPKKAGGKLVTITKNQANRRG
jgi:membrane-bound lytic murein transglycosylase D